MSDQTAAAMHDAIRDFLAALARGGICGDNSMMSRRSVLESPQIQAMSDAADAWERQVKT